jgi:acetolactate synthase-1/2/3 large subunit
MLIRSITAAASLKLWQTAFRSPTRYDQAVAALGAHGELVTSADEFPSTVDRAFSRGRPACVNVMIEQVPAPVIDA